MNAGPWERRASPTSPWGPPELAPYHQQVTAVSSDPSVTSRLSGRGCPQGSGPVLGPGHRREGIPGWRANVARNPDSSDLFKPSRLSPEEARVKRTFQPNNRK